MPTHAFVITRDKVPVHVIVGDIRKAHSIFRDLALKDSRDSRVEWAISPATLTMSVLPESRA